MILKNFTTEDTSLLCRYGGTGVGRSYLEGFVIIQIIQNSIADRLGGKGFGKNTELYKFVKIKKAKLEAI